MHGCLFLALNTTLVWCARSQDFVLSVSVRRVHVALSTAGKLCRKMSFNVSEKMGVTLNECLSRLPCGSEDASIILLKRNQIQSV